MCYFYAKVANFLYIPNFTANIFQFIKNKSQGNVNFLFKTIILSPIR